MATFPELLNGLREGSQTALNQLVSLLYDELHRIAEAQLRRERPSHTLQATALVHEVYLKLVDNQGEFVDRVHFLAIASRVTRQVLVDYARARSAKKRSAELAASPENSFHRLEVPGRQVQLLDLNSALEALDQKDQRLARLVEMCYFGGMTAEETAAALDESVHVVRHDLRLAQAWLRRKLRS
jgi:RNA polymerase sigma factor (TIGR02999 family)